MQKQNERKRQICQKANHRSILRLIIIIQLIYQKKQKEENIENIDIKRTHINCCSLFLSTSDDHSLHENLLLRALHLLLLLVLLHLRLDHCRLVVHPNGAIILSPLSAVVWLARLWVDCGCGATNSCLRKGR